MSGVKDIGIIKLEFVIVMLVPLGCMISLSIPRNHSASLLLNVIKLECLKRL